LIDSDGKINYEKMLNHSYLDQVFHETLRMHPPLALINRECSEAITLEDENGNSFRVEKGFSVNVPIMAIQNDPG
jgi:cytochrome P450